MEKYLNRLVERKRRGELTRREFLTLATGVVGYAAALSLLSACGEEEAAEATATTAPTAVPTQAPPTATSVPPTATPVPPTPTPEGPRVGGKLRWAINAEPETLNPLDVASGHADEVAALIHGSLVDLYPDGTYGPYLAESWVVSEDGLTWDFTLKKGIQFHDGTPCTAKEYAWTIQLALDEQRAAADTAYGSITAVEALDDYTLRLTAAERNFSFLVPLVDPGRAAPIPPGAYEELGDQFGRRPIGVGPFMFKEWRTGDRLILERNPDFNWGQGFGHQGPFYIETLEIRFIPEYATMLAGLEAGEIDLVGSFGLSVEPKDVGRVKDTGMYQLFEGLESANIPSLWMNVTVPPFDDLRVRQALNLAIDRQKLIKAAVQDQGVEQRGPISASTIGYWSGIEEIGYGYDLERAKALMAEAGWTDSDGDGVLDKDGEPFRFVFPVSNIAVRTAVAEIVQQQYKDLGVEIEIQIIEHPQLIEKIRAGDFEFCLWGAGYPEAFVMWLTFHSAMAGGGWNVGQIRDPELDRRLDLMLSELDLEKHQEAVNQAAIYIVEQAYMVPLYAGKTFYALSNKVKGAQFSVFGPQLRLNDAWIEETV